MAMDLHYYYGNSTTPEAQAQIKQNFIQILKESFFKEVVCKAGSYSPSGAQSCFACDKGSYQNMEGQFSCLKCGPNQTTSAEGSISSLQCGGIQRIFKMCCIRSRGAKSAIKDGKLYIETSKQKSH